MFRKMYNKWIAVRAFNALYYFATTLAPRSEEHAKVVEVLDILRTKID